MPKIISQLNNSSPEYGQYREPNPAPRETPQENPDRTTNGGAAAAPAPLGR